MCLLGVGKLVASCLAAADELAADGIDATVWDVRVVSPPDAAMLDDAAAHAAVVTRGGRQPAGRRRHVHRRPADPAGDGGRTPRPLGDGARHAPAIRGPR